ncbi:WavE lipopolysaccharide synthesis family protein [Photobacterium alginatilyticum]|uniref:WavE lipopolysaccharide synthesis family protein n=1 Tax=Photobacterium alginatilyticum TaxID=1775171 RepID=UPI0040682544
MQSSDITFLVQGPIRERTKESLQSIRKSCPESKIILSTWQGEDISGLEYDDLVLNEDPGSLKIYLDDEVVNNENTNRQILSVSNAISHVKTEYCVKTRTDIEFVNDNFIKLYEDNYLKYSRDSDNTLLKQRVLISSINTPNPSCFLQFVCQVSDWFFFGLTKDLKEIWCQDLITQSDYYHNENNVPDREYKNGFYFGRFSAEQLISLGFLKKHNESLPTYFRDKDFIDFTNRLLSSEFIVAEPNRIGFTFLKYRNYCELNFKKISDVKSYLAFYSVTTNFVRWNQLCSKYDPTKRESVKYFIHEKLCMLFSQYLKKKIYKL